jgi:hypothetical protein
MGGAEGMFTLFLGIYSLFGRRGCAFEQYCGSGDVFPGSERFQPGSRIQGKKGAGTRSRIGIRKENLATIFGLKILMVLEV